MTDDDVVGGWQINGGYASADGMIAATTWQFGAMAPAVAGDEATGLVLDGYVLNRTAVAAAAGIVLESQSGDGAGDLADAQLLLSLWRRHGAAAIADVEGDFNFLVAEDGQVHLVSSRLGARHLYWLATDEYVAFATRMSLIMRLPDCRPQVDRLAMMEMFNFGYVGGSRSLLAGVQLLPPATCLHIRPEAVTPQRYWQLDYANENSSEPFDDLVTEAIEAYRDSVDEHLRRFPRATIPLSGGLDSRTLLAFAAQRRSGIPVHHCSWYEGEARIARQLTDVCQAQWHEYDPLNFDYAAVLREGMNLAEGNIHSHQFWFLPLIQELSSQGDVDVVLDGYLMDVMFGDTFLILPARRGVGADETRRIINGLWRRCRPDLVRRIFSPAFFDEYEAANHTSIDQQLSTIDEPLLSNRIQAFSLHNRSNRYSVALPNVQRQYADYAYPGTSRRLLDLYRRIPPHYKAGAKFARSILSRAEPRVAAVPWAKTGRPVTQDKGTIDRLLERLPVRQAASMLLLRATAGRVDVSHRADLNRHFRRHASFRQAFLDIAEDERTFNRGIIDPDGLKRLVGMIDRGWPVLFLLQALVTVELFQRQFVDEA